MPAKATSSQTCYLRAEISWQIPTIPTTRPVASRRDVALRSIVNGASCVRIFMASSKLDVSSPVRAATITAVTELWFAAGTNSLTKSLIRQSALLHPVTFSACLFQMSIRPALSIPKMGAFAYAFAAKAEKTSSSVRIKGVLLRSNILALAVLMSRSKS